MTQDVPKGLLSSPTEVVDLSRLTPMLAEYRGQRGAVIPILQRAQDLYGYLPREALRRIAKETRVPLQQLYGVATFYAQFRLTQRGRHLLRVCDGTACHVRGAPKNVAAIEKTLGIEPGETTKDFKYTFEIVYCLGSCGLAPVALVDEKVLGRLVPETLVESLKELK
jgi:NADH-quinone oxidoreductase subunit E